MSASPVASPLWRRFALFTVPMIVTNVLQSLEGTINMVWLGHLLDVRAVAAQAAYFPVLILFAAASIGVSSGASVLMGQAWGAQRVDRVHEVMGTTLALTVLTGLVIAVFGAPNAHAILHLFNTPPEVIDAATGYARIMMAGTPIFFLLIVFSSLMRAVGDARTPLALLIAGIAGALVFSPVFILGLLGLPAMGVRGAALGMQVSWAVSLIGVTVWMVLRHHPLAPRAATLRGLKMPVATVRTVLRLGLPAMSQVTSVALSEMVLLGLINSFGPHSAAAYGIFLQLFTFAQFPAIGIAITVSVMCAHAIGRGDTHEVAQVTRLGLYSGLVITTLIVLLMAVFALPAAHIFTQDAQASALIVKLLRLVGWSCIAYALSGVLSFTMRAGGDVLVPSLISIGAIFLVEMPVAYRFSGIWGVEGVWLGYPAGYCATLLATALYYGLVWRRRPIRALEGHAPAEASQI